MIIGNKKNSLYNYRVILKIWILWSFFLNSVVKIAALVFWNNAMNNLKEFLEEFLVFGFFYGVFIVKFFFYIIFSFFNNIDNLIVWRNVVILKIIVGFYYTAVTLWRWRRFCGFGWDKKELPKIIFSKFWCFYALFFAFLSVDSELLYSEITGTVENVEARGFSS